MSETTERPTEEAVLETPKSGPFGLVGGVIKTARPRQWVKNVLVFAAPFFAFSKSTDRTGLLIDAVIAFPIAFYMAKVARPRYRHLLVVAVLTPLWASYLVKAYAWRTLLAPDGPLSWASGGHTPGYGETAGAALASRRRGIMS